MIGRCTSLMLLLSVVSGCGFGRYVLSNPDQDRILRVENGDRFYFKLPEDDIYGGRWTSTCDDPDVEVRIKHEPGEASVCFQVHRGYDGPSALTFRRLRPGVSKPDREFTLTLYRHTSDSAFWK